MTVELMKDLAVFALLLVAIGCAIEIGRCVRRVTAAHVRALDAQASYWLSVDEDEWWKRGEGKPT